jgi:hypothetical protein
MKEVYFIPLNNSFCRLLDARLLASILVMDSKRADKR